MADTESVTIQMADILDEVSRNCKGVYETESMSTARKAVQKLKSTSPRGRKGDYAKGWKVSKRPGGGSLPTLVVHNATDYQLTHLLENSHVIRNAKGEYGRTSPGHGQIIHIAPVEKWSIEELPQRVMKGLDNKL